jgi:uncharacterized protein YbbK (DUF523 family)
MKTRIAVSACLVGFKCRYDGKSNRNESVVLLEEHPDVELIPVCPECLGGLPVPRECSERKEGKVVTSSGIDVTRQFEQGSQLALKKVLESGCKIAILKARSPSCGTGTIYDGTFSHTVVSGSGLFSALLQENGIKVFSEEQLPLLQEQSELQG